MVSLHFSIIPGFFPLAIQKNCYQDLLELSSIVSPLQIKDRNPMQTSTLCYQSLLSLCVSHPVAPFDLAFRMLNLKFCAQTQLTFPV